MCHSREHHSRMEESSQFFRMHEVPGEPNSHTRMELIERQGAFARYRLKPVTGKRHQLRVHMAALGQPLMGDPLYPEVNDPEEGDYSNPLQLLARSLEFVDPVTGERLYRKPGTPASLERFLNRNFADSGLAVLQHQRAHSIPNTSNISIQRAYSPSVGTAVGVVGVTGVVSLLTATPPGSLDHRVGQEVRSSPTPPSVTVKVTVFPEIVAFGN